MVSRGAGLTEPRDAAKSLGSCSRAMVDTLGPPMQSSVQYPVPAWELPTCSNARIPSSTLALTVIPPSAHVSLRVQDKGVSDLVTCQLEALMFSVTAEQ